MKALTFSIILLSVSAFGQNIFRFNSELEKYWYYRDRLQYFVYPGDAPGNSVIITSRNPCKDYHDYFPIYTSIELAQTHKLMGYYIGMLATEYKLLMDNLQTKDANSTLMELNFALDALIRMDKCEDDIPWECSIQTAHITQYCIEPS